MYVPVCLADNILQETQDLKQTQHGFQAVSTPHSGSPHAVWEDYVCNSLPSSSKNCIFAKIAFMLC